MDGRKDKSRDEWMHGLIGGWVKGVWRAKQMVDAGEERGDIRSGGGGGKGGVWGC